MLSSRLARNVRGTFHLSLIVRPVYPTGLNRVLPAQGFSLSELDDAGVDLEQAEMLGLPVDAGRVGVYGPNVTVLRDFVCSSRSPI